MPSKRRGIVAGGHSASIPSSSPALLKAVRERLEEDWSPQQIAVWLKRAHADDVSLRVSHEAIYRTIYLAGRRELGPKAAKHLRSGRSVRHARKVKDSHGRGRLRNMVSIRERPAVVTERAELGHWEGDLVMGKRPSAVATPTTTAVPLWQPLRLRNLSSARCQAIVGTARTSDGLSAILRPSAFALPRNSTPLSAATGPGAAPTKRTSASGSSRSTS